MSRGTDTPERTIAQRYALERELGRGGMGTVYLARDLKHDRRVAIKFLGGGAAGAGDAARFLAEIRIAARLNHPHILQVHDSGTADDELFYVMPHVEGASLRERLDRDRRMPLPDALRTACHVADALAYAHAHGVIHRDIKPENILLDRQDHAYVADFGLARALSSVASSRLTATGLTVGSPPYMSPEQAAGDEDLDGRSDLYSLGCVFFEMLAGQPPFSGGRAQNVLRQHLTEPPPSLRSRRADVPPELERVLHCLLAKDPDDRYATADELRDDLEGLLTTSASERGATAGTKSGRRRRLVAGLAAAAATGLVLLGVWSVIGAPSRLLPGTAAVDTARYAVLPLEGSAATGSHHLMLYEAFARWEDLDLADRLEVADIVARNAGARQLSGATALEAARQLRAGRYVHGSAEPLGDSILVDVGLFDAAENGRLIRSESLRLPARSSLSLAASYAGLADRLLFGSASAGISPGDETGTRSTTARQRYDDGLLALQRWDLAAADSLLSSAVAEDPAFASAHLWLAQVRNWSGDATERWAANAERALYEADALRERDRPLAAGLAALAAGRYPDACASFEVLRASGVHRFAAWYGLGECRSRDDRVVPDASSPSGWRYRSSYHAGVEAYRHAFEILPQSHIGFRGNEFGRVREILYTRGNRLRAGWASDDRSQPYEFLSYARLDADTLVFVPYPRDEWQDVEWDMDAARAANRQQRDIFGSIAAGWATDYPSSPDAAYAQAVALGMLGDPAALEWIARARALSPDPAQSMQLAGAEAWLQVRFAAGDAARLRRARELADSVLAFERVEGALDAGRLAPLAALIGRPVSAAGFARSAARGEARTHSFVHRSARATLAFASLAAPIDSIRSTEDATRDGIRHLPDSESAKRDATEQLLAQPAMLAFPAHVSPVLIELDALPPLLQAQAAFMRGDERTLDSLLATLRPLPPYPADFSPDVNYATARLLALAGDTTGAIRWLDTSLEALRWQQPDMLERLETAGVIGRTMALRARLADRTGDEVSARRWARAAVALWGEADPALRPALQGMRGIAGD